MGSFISRVVDVQRIDGALTVSLADSAAGPENYLLLMRSEGDTEYYIEWNDQSRSGYGGVESVALGNTELVVLLNQVGRKSLRTAGPIRARFLHQDTSRELRDGLLEIFRGTGVFRSIDT